MQVCILKAGSIMQPSSLQNLPVMPSRVEDDQMLCTSIESQPARFAPGIDTLPTIGKCAHDGGKGAKSSKLLKHIETPANIASLPPVAPARIPMSTKKTFQTGEPRQVP